MDDIVRDIYTAMEEITISSHAASSPRRPWDERRRKPWPSSPGEVSTALTFISPKFKSAFEGHTSPVNHAVDYQYYDTVEQSDIVPTLAALLGFPVPLNNLGVIIPSLLELWTVQQTSTHYSMKMQSRSIESPSDVSGHFQRSTDIR